MNQKQNNAHDVLGAYPEKEQVDAFPERRYIKLTRFLTIFTIINLAFVISWAGLYFYMARHKDISVSKSNWVHIYSIDPERKLLLPSEFGHGHITAKQLMMEKTLRKYLTERYEFIWSIDTMNKRWGKNGYVSMLSSDDVKKGFQGEVNNSWNSIQQNRVTRDVHIYDLYRLQGDLWSAYLETFDLPIDENLSKKCDCSDNSHSCIVCKEKNTTNRQRKKILLRADFSGAQTLENPLGISIKAYYPALVPIPEDKPESEKFWDLPPALRPVL